MRWSLLAIFILTLPFSPLNSTSQTAELTPYCGGHFQLCGYREKGSKTHRIPMRFEIAQPFHEGLAAVRFNGLHGYIDLQGKLVIEPQFQAAGPFSGGYAEVRVNGASGIVNRAGRLVVPAKFKRIVPFHNGTFIAAPLSDQQPHDAGRREQLSGLSNVAFIGEFRQGGLYHIKRGWLTEQDMRFDLFDAPERGLIWAGSENEQNEEIWGLLKSDGSWKVSPRYSHVQQIMETHAVVQAMPDYSLPPKLRQESMLRGAVDRDGNLVVPTKFKQLSYWRGGYGYAFDDKPYNLDGTPRKVKQGIVRADGSLLAGRYFDEVDIREDGLLPRGRVGSTWHSIRPDGKLVPDQINGKPLLVCDNGLAIVRSGDMAEFRLSLSGKSIGKFENGYFANRDCPGPFSARRGGKWFIIMDNGEVLGGAKGFDNNYSFSGSHAAVQIDGKWGIIDRTGKFSVKPTFAKLRPGSKDTFVVGENEDTYWINANGDRIAEPVRARVEPNKALTCQGGLQFFQKDDLWGFRDETGKTVISPKFQALSCFRQGVSWAASPDFNAWCPIGPDGLRRTEMACREGYYPMTVTHHWPEQFSKDPYKSSVLWMRAWLDHNAGKRENPPKWIPDVRGRGSYSVMEGSPVGPERNPASSKLLIGAGIAGLSLALAGFVFWRR